MKRKRNIAYTSVLSWKECIAKGLPLKENQLVFKFLFKEKKAKNSRQIATCLQIERTNITRTLYNLEKESLIIVKKVDKCPITNKLVRFYGVNETHYKSRAENTEFFDDINIR